MNYENNLPTISSWKEFHATTVQFDELGRLSWNRINREQSMLYNHLYAERVRWLSECIDEEPTEK